jgi:hypothetical protein
MIMKKNCHINNMETPSLRIFLGWIELNRAQLWLWCLHNQTTQTVQFFFFLEFLASQKGTCWYLAGAQLQEFKLREVGVDSHYQPLQSCRLSLQIEKIRL